MSPNYTQDDQWNQVEQAAERLKWRLTIVIYNGRPGGYGGFNEAGDPLYKSHIDRIRAHGARFYGYLATCDANTMQSDLLCCPRPSFDCIIEEVDDWNNQFGGLLRGMLVDDVSVDADDGKIDFYRRLARHISTKKGPPLPGSNKPYIYDCIFAYSGVPTHDAYKAMRNPPATGCYVVRSVFSIGEWEEFSPPNWLLEVDSMRKIPIASDVNKDNWREALRKLTQDGFNCVWGLTRDPWFDELVEEIASMDTP